LAYGRCAPQKGFDLVARAYARLHREFSPLPRLQLLMPAETSDDWYVRLVATQLAGVPAAQVRLASQFDENAPLRLLTDPHLVAVVFASRYECAPLAPIETLVHAPRDVPIVAIDIPPMRDVLEGVENVLLVGRSGEELVSALRAVVSRSALRPDGATSRSREQPAIPATAAEQWSSTFGSRIGSSA
jgi:glycosyltransferase involved in cell wall biosynthesis